MTMHQMLRIDEHISFLTVSAERGEKCWHLKISTVQSPSSFLVSPAIITLLIKKPYYIHLTMNLRGKFQPSQIRSPLSVSIPIRP